MLADKSVLILLDNARTAAQLHPLLPASTSSAVVITSREELSSFVVRTGAARLGLEELTVKESLDLMRTTLEAERVDQEEDAAIELCMLCGCLPLALRIATELLGERGGGSITALVGRLRDEQTRLSLLETSDGDENTALRAVFDRSYRTLPADAQRAFRLLALHRGPSIGMGAASALLGVPDGRRALDALVHANLLERTGSGRYGFHDLLRLFAAAQPVEPDERRAAAGGMLAWYLDTTWHADRVLAPGRPAVPLDPECPAAAGLRFSGQRDALEWFDGEQRNVVAVIQQAAEEGLDAWRLAAAAGEYFYVRRLWADWESTHRAALAVAERHDDTMGVAWMLTNLGVLALERERVDESVTHLETALALLRGRRIAEPAGLHLEGLVTTTLGNAMLRLGHLERSGRFHSASLCIHRRTGNAWCEGETLMSLARTKAAQHDHATAVALLTEAVNVEQRIGNWCRVGLTLARLAHARRQAGDPAGAERTFTEAFAVLLDSGDRWGAAWCLVHRDDLRLARGVQASWDEVERLFADDTQIITERRAPVPDEERIEELKAGRQAALADHAQLAAADPEEAERIGAVHAARLKELKES